MPTTVVGNFGFQSSDKCIQNRWQAIIEGWNKAILRYCRIQDGSDVPYHYNERANICLLASGALLSGATVLEEFRCNKGQANAPLTGGRTDLYISTKEWDAEIEAKQKYINTQSKMDRIKAIAKKTLDAAENDVNQAARTGTDYRYACAFFPLWSPQGTGCNKLESRNQRIESVRSCLASTKSADLWAWCFPTIAENYVDSEQDKSISYYPGVILGLKKIRNPK